MGIRPPSCALVISLRSYTVLQSWAASALPICAKSSEIILLTSACCPSACGLWLVIYRVCIGPSPLASEVTKQGVHGVPSDFWELSGGCQVAQSHLALVVSFSCSCARQSWIPAGFVFAEGTQV